MSLKYLLSFTCAAVLASSAHAQINSPDQPQPGVPSPQAVIPAGRLDDPGILYHLPPVPRIVNVPLPPINRLSELTVPTPDQYRNQYLQMSTLKVPDREARLRVLDQPSTNDQEKAARDKFLEEQRNLFQKVYKQYGGFSTLTDPALARRLHLSPEQQHELDVDLAWNNQQLRRIYNRSAVNQEAAMQMYRDYEREYGERFSKLLSPEQAKAWLDMSSQR